MPAIIVDNIVKNFGDLRAVDGVSFDVEPGEIFGLLGPNGAGKTTAIRIMLDIFKPDSGSVSILGGSMTEEKKNLIGYLPEERGLYQDIPLERCLVYLATLKGLDETNAKKKVSQFLERFDLADYSKKKVKELSKGMQQKAQLITTLIHEPSIVIIDEPFSALDPVNTQMVRDLLREERAKGTAVVMCTHQMHQVEELADRIALINNGRTMLYGGLDKIRRQYQSNSVIIRPLATLPTAITGVDKIEKQNSHYLLHLSTGVTAQQVLKTMMEQEIGLEQFEMAIPSLDEIFIQVVNEVAAK
jgi:ABC-2 type transport system ATP-binding protein